VNIPVIFSEPEDEITENEKKMHSIEEKYGQQRSNSKEEKN
jgi:hypothetical protein